MMRIVGESDRHLKMLIEKALPALKEGRVVAIFERACPDCFFHVASEDLLRGETCGECSKFGDGGFYSVIRRIKEEVEEFSKFFEKLLGFPPNSIQRMWALKILSGQNAAIVAPTGTGKTTFGIITALWLAHKYDKVSYIVLPTRTLLMQVLEKVKQWEEKLGKKYVIAYLGRTSKDREKFFEELKTGRYRVIITTLQFFSRYLKQINDILRVALRRERAIDFLFVDDVDSFLRNPLNLLRSLLVLGYTGVFGISEIVDKLKERAALIARGQFEQIPSLTREEWDTIIEARKKCGLLVVSSATGRVRGTLTRLLLSMLLGMSIGGEKEGKRNVLDIYDDSILRHPKVTNDLLVKRAAELVKLLGGGGLIFVAVGPDSDEIISKLLTELSKRGVKAAAVTESVNAALINDFRNGKIDVLVGKAFRYGLLVRGLDLPERVRYTLFVKIPRFSARVEVKFGVNYLTFVVKRLLRAIAPDAKEARALAELIRELISHVTWLGPTVLRGVERTAQELTRKAAKATLAPLVFALATKNTGSVAQVAPLPELDDTSSAVLLEYVTVHSTARNEDERRMKRAVELTMRLAHLLASFLEEDPVKKLREAGIPFEIREENGKKSIYVLSADVKTYIQASGRASRLYAGGITYGISIILPANRALLEDLERRLRWAAEASLKPLSEVDLKEELKKVDEDRKKVVQARMGLITPAETLKTALFIVESPRKAKTIASFFGKPIVRVLPGAIAYETIIGNYLMTIIATMGHITDLVTHEFKPIFSCVRERDRIVKKISGWRLEMLRWPYGVEIVEEREGKTSRRYFIPIFGLRVSCPYCMNAYIPHIALDDANENLKRAFINYVCGEPKRARSIHDLYRFANDVIFPLKCPVCGHMIDPQDRLSMLQILRLLASESDVVFLGTDPDMEGEKIAWDLYVLLKPFAKNIVRVEFHEVTRRAIEEALKNPRSINMKLVRAQIARRVEDRWIGFLLSEELRQILGEKNLSAGRVQTPVLGWIVEAYRKWEEKKKGVKFLLTTDRGPVEITVQLSTIKKPKRVRVEVLECREEPTELTPPPPLTTDTMLTYASLIYGFDVQKTMQLAQRLYECGLVTYIRTDSTRVSDAGIALGKKLVSDYFGPELHVPRNWARGPEEGAHECIRPTRPLMLEDLREAIEYEEIVLPEELPPEAFDLYDLITRVFAASQMKKAKVKMMRVRLRITVEGEDEKGQLVTETHEEEVRGLYEIVEDGFIRAYNEQMKQYLLPRRVGRPTAHVFPTVDFEMVEIRGGRLYTEGELVKMMKERNIGRPSTYAIIIRKLFARKYVKRIGRYIYPTKRGITVYEILSKLHGNLVSEQRTSELIKKLDEIEKAPTEEESIKKFNEVMEKLFEEMEFLRNVLEKRQWFKLVPEKTVKEILEQIREYKERAVRSLLP